MYIVQYCITIPQTPFRTLNFGNNLVEQLRILVSYFAVLPDMTYS